MRRLISPQDVVAAAVLGAGLFAFLQAAAEPRPAMCTVPAPATSPAPSRVWDMKWILASLPQVPA